MFGAIVREIKTNAIIALGISGNKRIVVKFVKFGTLIRRYLASSEGKIFCLDVSVPRRLHRN